jgi:CO/xanthine dehydrogenase FAD-binding subunit
MLDAVLELAGFARGAVTVREVPVAEFFRGPGCTALQPGEILVRIRFSPQPQGCFAVWEKAGTRPAMEIAVASVGVALTIIEGTVAHARVGYGSVAPVPLRGRQAETVLGGHTLSANVIGRCAAAARDEVKPITDVRASEAYRREIVGVMLTRMLERAQRSQNVG